MLKKFDDVLKTALETPIEQDRRSFVESQLRAYFEKDDFKQELAELNSFAALKAFADKLSKVTEYFRQGYLDPYQTLIRIKQASLVRPNRWRDLEDEQDVWEFLRRCYGFSPEVQGKAAFLQAYQTWLVGDVKEPFRELLHDIATDNLTKLTASLADPELCALLNQSPYPLLFAARKGNEAIFDLLLAKGADPHVIDRQGETALHHVARRGSVPMVVTLLKNNLDVSKANKDGETPLHIAAEFGHAGIVSTLIENTPEGQAIQEHRSTLLHWAAAGGYPALFAGFSDYTVKDGEGYTPFMRAAQNGRLNAIEMLYPYFLLRNLNYTWSDGEGSTAFLLAAANGHVAVFNWLLKKGADPLAKDKSGKDCLALALEKGESAIILAALKAKINRHALTEAEIHAVLEKAYQNNHKEIIEFFLGFINLSKTKLPVLEKVHDPAAMLQNGAAGVQELTDYIDERLQVLNINGMPAEMAYKFLIQNTPRQLASLRRMDRTLNNLINDEVFVNSLVRAYGLEEEYAALREKAATRPRLQIPRGNFARFYTAYLQTWISPEHAKVNEIAEELLHALATSQQDSVKMLLAREEHGYVRDFAHPLRLVARKGNTEAVKALIAWKARMMPIWSAREDDEHPDEKRAALVEAARGNHLDCVKILFDNKFHLSTLTKENALFDAAAYGHNNIVNYLLDQEVFNAKAMVDALVFAAEHGHVSLVNDLLARSARDDRYQIDNSRREWALYNATRNNHPAVVEALLKVTVWDPLELNNALSNACLAGKAPLVAALLTATQISDFSISNALFVAIQYKHTECVTLLLNKMAILPSGITRGLITALAQNRTEAFNLLMQKSQAEPNKYKIDSRILEAEIARAMEKNIFVWVSVLLSQFAPYLTNIEEKIIWACRYKQPEVIKAILGAHPRAVIREETWQSAISVGNAACITALLDAASPPDFAHLIRYALGRCNTNIVAILFQGWQAKHFVTRDDVSGVCYLGFAQLALTWVSPKPTLTENQTDRLTLVREMFKRWQAKSLLSLHTENTTRSFANQTREFCLLINLYSEDVKRNCRDALLDICDEMLDNFARELSEKQKKTQTLQQRQQTAAQVPAIEPQQAMLVLLKEGLEQIRSKKKAKVELVVATYFMLASVLDERFTHQQKLEIIQAYQAFVKPWWQTCATALVCIISGAIGLVLGAAAGIGIGILAGSWSGPGMALTALAGALAGSVQGATVGVAAGAAVTGLVAGTAGLLAAKGLFKTPEQQLAEAVKLQLNKHKPCLT